MKMEGPHKPTILWVGGGLLLAFLLYHFMFGRR